ncbi:MAG: hypothetical protein A3E78_11775 [Alphaproteobacteria bacterium RIFCSPHIGHO2_12_FULL_63_12]|nr:MAG: hypothetical protein A3E78_11775 [Alphaproteobacteria bacterium RIFCSPHIGHO2_12_FULL_63_12]
MTIERAKICATGKSMLALILALTISGLSVGAVLGMLALVTRLPGVAPLLVAGAVLVALIAWVMAILCRLSRAAYLEFVVDCRRAVALDYPWWYWLPWIGRPLPPAPAEPERDLVAEFMRTASWNLVMDREQLLRAYTAWLDEDEEADGDEFGRGERRRDR